MPVSAFGIDLGTSNIKIYAKGEEEVFIAKNMIAIEGRDNLFAYGDNAFEMYEKLLQTSIFPIPLITAS